MSTPGNDYADISNLSSFSLDSPACNSLLHAHMYGCSSRCQILQQQQQQRNAPSSMLVENPEFLRWAVLHAE
jgi:hypothetical protein